MVINVKPLNKSDDYFGITEDEQNTDKINKNINIIKPQDDNDQVQTPTFKMNQDKNEQFDQANVNLEETKDQIKNETKGFEIEEIKENLSEIPKNEAISFRDYPRSYLHGEIQTKKPIEKTLENKEEVFSHIYEQQKRKIDQEESNPINNFFKKVSLFQEEFSRSKWLRKSNIGGSPKESNVIENEIKSRKKNEDSKEINYTPRFRSNIYDNHRNQASPSINLNHSNDIREDLQPEIKEKLDLENRDNYPTDKFSIYCDKVNESIDKIRQHLKDIGKNNSLSKICNKQVRESSLPPSKNRKPQQIANCIPLNLIRFKEDSEDHRKNTHLSTHPHQIDYNPLNFLPTKLDLTYARGKSFENSHQKQNFE